jgi:hypothetical protein
MIDVYTSPPRAALCTEVAKLKIALNEGALVTLRPPKATKRLPAANASSTAWPISESQRRRETPRSNSANESDPDGTTCNREALSSRSAS